MIATRVRRLPTLPPLPPDEPFRCAKYACTLRAAVCIQRQSQRRSHPRSKKTWPVHDYCGSGKCAQGAEIRKRVVAGAIDAPALLDSLSSSFGRRPKRRGRRRASVLRSTTKGG